MPAVTSSTATVMRTCDDETTKLRLENTSEQFAFTKAMLSTVSTTAGADARATTITTNNTNSRLSDIWHHGLGRGIFCKFMTT